MHEVRSIRFQSRHRLRLRRLVRGDLPGLRWLRERHSTHSLEAIDDGIGVEELIDEAPLTQIGVELDHQLAGVLLAVPIASRPEQVAQPWDRLGQVPTPKLVPTGDILRGCGAIWRDDLSAAQTSEVLTVGRKALVQQLGLDATVSVVEAPGWASWRGRMSARAYLQQVHAGGFGDLALRVFLENGWVMRGFCERGECLEVVMWWGNRAR